MYIEDVAGKSLPPQGAAQQQRELAVGQGMAGQQLHRLGGPRCPLADGQAQAEAQFRGQCDLSLSGWLSMAKRTFSPCRPAAAN